MTKGMKEDARSFTVVSSSFGLSGGRYVSPDPADAGRKAGRKLFDKANKNKQNNVVFLEVKEITRSKKVAHSKERYFYKVDRMLIPESKRVVRKFKKEDGTVSTFTPMYDYEIKSISKEDYPGEHLGGGYPEIWKA